MIAVIWPNRNSGRAPCVYVVKVLMHKMFWLLFDFTLKLLNFVFTCFQLIVPKSFAGSFGTKLIRNNID